MNKDLKLNIANLAQQNKTTEITKILDQYLKDKNIGFKTNYYYAQKFNNWLKYGGKLPFSTFTVGNSKLPFLSFSTLPGVTCPGASDCLNYCYSYKAWRYPAAYFRQVQNTILMHNFNLIKLELEKVLNSSKFKNLDKIDFRLYVDGDFSNEKDLKNWIGLISNFPKLNTYGYSKSLNLFLKLHDEGFKFPKNYCLNLSNGGKYDSLKKIMQNLYFVRGNFTAWNLNKNEIREKYNKKVFICPGVCGSCTNIGHACGNLDVFKNIEIVIPVH